MTLTIKTKNQAALLKAKKLVVKVRSTRKTRVAPARRLAAATVASSGRSPSRFKKRGVPHRFPGADQGRPDEARQMRRPDRSRSIGKYRKGKKKAKAKRSKRLAKDTNRCQDPVDYVTVPLGDDPEHCDFLDSTICLQPFPNDYYTKADASTPTGKRLNFAPTSTPKNTGTPNRSTSTSPT